MPAITPSCQGRCGQRRCAVQRVARVDIAGVFVRNGRGGGGARGIQDRVGRSARGPAILRGAGGLGLAEECPRRDRLPAKSPLPRGAGPNGGASGRAPERPVAQHDTARVGVGAAFQRGPAVLGHAHDAFCWTGQGGDGVALGPGAIDQRRQVERGVDRPRPWCGGCWSRRSSPAGWPAERPD